MIKSRSLGLSAGTVTAIAFGICGLFFAVSPTSSAAVMGWIMHSDMTTMTHRVSAFNLIAGVIVLGIYVGLIVGLIAAFYNRLTTPRTG
ncbi:MAG TPA: DUF5676 family membrane protein [Gemmatimonadaceae bacterium]|nr:DUF5676 family membrane protein [Gemmatimonadaceae bacterium]